MTRLHAYATPGLDFDAALGARIAVMGRGVEEGAEPRGPLPVAWGSSASYLTPPMTFYTENSLRRKHKILTFLYNKSPPLRIKQEYRLWN